MHVTIITEDAVRELAGFNGEGVPVTTCYLDVDGRRYHRHLEYEQELDHLLRKARNSANGTPSVNRDLKRIEEYIKGGFDRSRTRGWPSSRAQPTTCGRWSRCPSRFATSL